MAICEQCNKDMLDPDVESCVKYPIKFPECKGQLISCGCLSEEYEEELYKMPLEELRKLAYKETK